MKERIRELAIQSGGHGLRMSTTGLSLLGEQQIEKFAELIVKECLSFCEYQGDHLDEYDSGMTERARIIRESIQEHFGVKE